MIKLTGFLLVYFFILSFSGRKDKIGKSTAQPTADTIPASLLGNFLDDYGISYSISDTVWIQRPSTRYHILKWNTKEGFLIACNDMHNRSEPGLYTRIDFTSLPKMEPFKWGFCLSVYNAKSDSLAETTYQADKLNPRKGCNGFPFSRMKRSE